MTAELEDHLVQHRGSKPPRERLVDGITFRYIYRGAALEGYWVAAHNGKIGFVSSSRYRSTYTAFANGENIGKREQNAAFGGHVVATRFRSEERAMVACARALKIAATRHGGQQ